MKKRAKMIINIIVLFLFILSLILMIIINGKENIVSVKAWNVVLSALSLVFAVYLLLHHFYALIIRSIVLVYNKIIKYIRVNLSNKCVNFGNQLKAKLNTENEEYHHLAPTYLEKSEYVRILKLQIDNPHIKNIAISGPYGSGKSSILHTFQLLYPQYRCLNLSLAAFALKEYTIEVDANKADSSENVILNDSIMLGYKCKGMEELEYSLVQQFFYHVKAKDIPDSRFGRIYRWNWYNKTKATVLIFSFFICCIYLIQPDWLKNITIFTCTDIFENTCLQYICLLVLGVILFYATYKLVSYVHKINGGRVKLMNYEIELQKDIKTSVFNRYLDELVYLFQITKYEIVILEDLDRFENTNIFARLRELNTLLNQSQDIGRRIVFIYALSDSVFEKSIERTKFFDFILPIISHTNPSNSADQFVNILGKLVNGEDESKDITKNFIKDIAPFICDLRTIKAISTEYKICSSLLDKKLSQQNLLAMVIYKNLYPKDFELIYKGEGKIIDVFKRKSELIDKSTSSIKEKIRTVNEEILNIKNESLRSIDELKSIVVAALVKQIPSSAYLCDKDRKRVAYKELFDDSSIENILNNKYQYYSTQYNSYYSINVFNNLDDKFNYESRKEYIVSKLEFKEHELQDTQKELESQCIKLNGISMKDLCSMDNSIVPIEKNGDKNTLLNFFIKRGYIDEQFYYYITILTEGILTKNDYDYLLSIKTNDDLNENDIINKLDNPSSLLKYLIPQDYRSSKIFNISLINEILNQKDEKNRNSLINKIKERSCDIIEFLRRYVKVDSINGEMIQLVVEHHKNLWSEIEDNLSISEEDKIFIFNILLKYADSFKIYLNNYREKRFKFFIEENPYTQYIKSPDTAKKFKEIIKNLNAKIREVSIDTSYNEFTDFLYQGNFYALNKKNVLWILQIYSNINLSLYDGAIYSAVLEANIEQLTSYINANIEHFVKECIISAVNTKEYESTIILLLNNEDISLDLKNCIIEHNKTIIENVDAINDNDLKNKLYTLNRVKPTLLNITCYLGYNDLDEIDSTLLEFINSNSGSIINCIKNSEENEIAIEALLKKEGVDDTIWQEIFNNPLYDKKIKSSLPYLRKEQFIFYVNTEEKADFILEHLKVVDIDLMRKILTLSKNKILKMKTLACYLDENAELEISCINDLLVAMGEEFAILTTNKGQNFEIKRTPEAELFIEQLIKRDIISRNGGTRAKIKVVVK